MTEIPSIPRDIQADTASQKLKLVWNDTDVSLYDFITLRGHCRCAACVDEWTGKRLLKLDDIPTDIIISKIGLVGNYALQITWSDGHDTGIFPWKRLYNIGHEVS